MCLHYSIYDLFLFFVFVFIFFFKEKTAYEMRISDWSSDVCSSDLRGCDRDPTQYDRRLVGEAFRARRLFVPGVLSRDHSAHHILRPARMVPGRALGSRRRASGASLQADPAALSLGLIQAAYITRLTRSAMLETLSQDYVRTAHAKGLPNRVVFYKHALKTVLIPVVTGVELGKAAWRERWWQY